VPVRAQEHDAGLTARRRAPSLELFQGKGHRAMIEDGNAGVVGDKKVLAALNQALKGELTAINQYFLHARMLDNWGFRKRGKAEYDESIDEMKHADRLIQRILLLGGLPNLQDLGKLYIGESLKEVIECDLKLELEGIRQYRDAIKIAEEAHDYVSRDLLVSILGDEEAHQDQNRTELELIDKIGIENFGQSQM
jgi:bacterioferritin